MHEEVGRYGRTSIGTDSVTHPTIAHLHSRSWDTVVCACVCIRKYVCRSFLMGYDVPWTTPAGVLGHLFFDLPLSDSIEHRRVHHQLEPDTVYIEGACICAYVRTYVCVYNRMLG